MIIGESTRFDQYRERINSGDDYVFEFTVHEDESSPCDAPLRGDPINGTGSVVSAAARVLGTFERLQVIGIKTFNGSDTEPIQVRVRVDRGDAIKALSEGALGGFAIQVRLREGSVRRTILKGLVTVLDAASRDPLA